MLDSSACRLDEAVMMSQWWIVGSDPQRVMGPIDESEVDLGTGMS